MSDRPLNVLQNHADAVQMCHILQDEIERLRDALRNLLDGRKGARDKARAALEK